MFELVKPISQFRGSNLLDPDQPKLQILDAPQDQYLNMGQHIPIISSKS